MSKRYKQIAALLMAFVMLLMNVPVLAQDTPDISLGASQPPGRNVIEVEVTIEDQPGVFIPAKDIWVSYKHHQVSNEVHGIYTDVNGYARIEQVPDDPRLLSGATFRVYRETEEGVKEYLNYHKMPLMSQTILPAFFPDAAQAFVFTSGRVFEGYLKGHILVPGLPTYWPGTDEPVTYYLEEVTGIPGYAPLTAPLAFSAQNFNHEEIEKNVYPVANAPIDRTITIFKTGDTRALNSGMGPNAGWAQNLAGAAFILLKPVPDETNAYWVLTGDGTAFSSETVVIENLQGRSGDLLPCLI